MNFEGTVYENFDWRLLTELYSSGSNNSGGASIRDAYIGAKAFDWLQLRVGRMKSPIGIERWQSASARWFTDLATTTYLVPNRENGAMLWGNVSQGLLEYYAGIFNGAPDGGSSNFSMSGQNTKDFEGRLAVKPFANMDIDGLEKLLVGAGVTYAPQLNGLGSYDTVNQQTFFEYSSSTIEATSSNPGEQVRFVPNASYFWGPFGLYAEAAWSTVGVSAPGYSTNLTNFGWQVAASWVLTGEDNSFGAIAPRLIFDPSNGGWGALQIAARVGQLTIDPAAFPIYANPATQASQSTTIGIGLNWILNENIKLTLEYDFTSFVGGGAGGGNRPEANAITSQFQMFF